MFPPDNKGYCRLSSTLKIPVARRPGTNAALVLGLLPTGILRAALVPGLLSTGIFRVD